MYLCEGFNLFTSAIQSDKITISEIILSNTLTETKKAAYVITEGRKSGIPLRICDKTIMQRISDTVTPSGVLFTVQSHVKSEQDLAICQDKAILFFEKITDPGNLGTIIRTAQWFGVKTIFLSHQCVDPYNMKAIRSSSGAIFESDLYFPVSLEGVIERFKKQNYQFIATAPRGGIAPQQWKIGKRNLLFFGSEAKGLSKSLLKMADIILTIPKSGRVESLNLAVATGIVLNELSKTKTVV
jgi:TrmH family RNA methyltransferase